MLGIAERMLAAPDVSSTLRAPPSHGASAERRTPATPARPESHERATPAPGRLTSMILEAAQRLGVSERLLRKEISSGRVPVVRLGRRTLIRRETSARLLTEGEARSRH